MTDITIGENLDKLIKQAEANLKELIETKTRLEKLGLLNARIEDLRIAMQCEPRQSDGDWGL